MAFLKHLPPVLAATLASAGAVHATMYLWSKTAGNNANSDSFTWAEGMAPSAVNDSARGMMAAIAKFRDDTSGSLVTGGISTAYTLTSNQVFTTLALMNGAELAFRMNATSGAAPTLNVDGLGAKALNQATGVAAATGALVSGAVYSAVYVNASNEWIVKGIAGAIPSGTSLISATTCPTGWTTGATHNDKALRLVTSSPGTSGGTVAFSTVFGRTATDGFTLLRTHLPNVSFTGANNIQVNFPFVAIQDGGTNYLTQDLGSIATRTVNQTLPTQSSSSTSNSISVASGGSSTAHTHAIDLQVQFVQVVSCVKD